MDFATKIFFGLALLLACALNGSAQGTVKKLVRPLFNNDNRNEALLVTPAADGAVGIVIIAGHEAVSQLKGLAMYKADTAGHIIDTVPVQVMPIAEKMMFSVKGKASRYVITLSLKNDAWGSVKLQVQDNTYTGKGIGVVIVEWPIGTVLRKRGQDGVHTYRIPGLITTANGTLVAVYDVRYKNSGDLPGDINIGVSTSHNGGRTWSPMRIAMSMGRGNTGVGDPAILYDKKHNTVWLAGLWSKGNNSIRGSKGGFSPDSTGQLLIARSVDQGKSFSNPINITRQVKEAGYKIFFQGPGTGIVMHNGTLVFPAQYWDATGVPHSTIIYSIDGGGHWHSGKGAPGGTTESTVAEIEKGIIMLNMRRNGATHRAVYVTSKMGHTWDVHVSNNTALSDPVCMANLLSVVDPAGKKWLLFSNMDNGSKRVNLTIKASADGGNSWKRGILIDERETYGYSAISRIDPDTIGVIYEGVGDIYFLSLPLKNILD